MARGALKMARKRLVANVKGGQFGPRAIFSHLHPAPPPPSPIKCLFGDSFNSFETIASPQMARQALESFFLARGQKYLRSTSLAESDLVSTLQVLRNPLWMLLALTMHCTCWWKTKLCSSVI